MLDVRAHFRPLTCDYERREWDSNPRMTKAIDGFQDRSGTCGFRFCRSPCDLQNHALTCGFVA